MPTFPVTVAQRTVKYAFPRDSEGIAKAHLASLEECLLRGKVLQLPPCVILFTEESEQVIDGRPFMSDGAGKDVLMALAKRVAREIRAIASVFFSETWFAVMNAEDRGRISRGMKPTMPSVHPDRLECVMAVGEYAGMEPRMAASQMVRDSAGRIISFKPFLMPSGMEYKGRFFGILDGIGDRP